MAAATKSSTKAAPAVKTVAPSRPKALSRRRAAVPQGAPCIHPAQARQRPDAPPGDPDPGRGRAARRRPVRQLSQSQPAVSHHLALLRHGGIIAPRRQGKNNFYSLTETGTDLARVVNNLID